jgi:hypothetical protein
MVELRFPTRVDSPRCELQLSSERRELTVVVPRAPHGFETRAMSELWLDDWDAWHSASHLQDRFFFFLGGLQFSAQEKRISIEAGGAPTTPWIAFKHVVCQFLVLGKERMELVRPEDRSIAALILHHGLRRDHRNGGVAADLSVCMLTPPIWDQVKDWWLHGGGAAVHSIRCGPEKYDLFQRFVRLLATRAKDADSWSVPPPRANVPAHLEPYFVRLLFPPLLPPDDVISDDLNASEEYVARRRRAGRRSRLEELKWLKDQGALLVRLAQHAEAIKRFQSALVYYLSLGDHGAAATPLAAQCYLNIAHCLLAARSPASASEVEVCCCAALDLLEKTGGGGTPTLLAKEHYRMGLARELSGDREGAVEALSAALRCTPK